MPCLRSLTSAFDRFASSFKLQHSTVFSGVPTTLTPSIIGAVSFTLIMAIVTINLLRSRAWFLWALSTASLLQCIGFIASAVHSQDGTNHIAFLASFATITFAPLLLSVAIFSTFGRLRQVVMPERVKQSERVWVHCSNRMGTLILLPCLLPVALFTMGLVNIGKFLSPAPIDGRNAAFGRLLQYELGISQLQKAHIAHACICQVFAIFTAVFTFKSRGWKVDTLAIKNKNWRELLHTINLANGMIIVRAWYKVAESSAIASSKASLGDNGPLFWLCDVLPMLGSLVLFCAIRPATYLPDQVPRIVLDPEAPSFEKAGEQQS